MKGSATALFWRSPGRDPLHRARGRRAGRRRASTRRRARSRRSGRAPTSLDDFAMARDGPVLGGDPRAPSRSRPRSAPGPIGAVEAADVASTRRRSACWGEAKSLHWESDGATRPGLAPLPARLRSRAAATRWSSSSTAARPPTQRHRLARRAGTRSLPSQGYFVFLPNPRGSYGFGEAFTQGNVKDFGGGDLRDILSGVDEALQGGARSTRRASASSAGATAAT